MFGNSRLNRQVERLENEVDTLREYTIKLTNDVNAFAERKNEELILISERIAKLEEK